MDGGQRYELPPITDSSSPSSPNHIQQAQSQKKHCHRRVAEHELNRASQQQQPIEKGALTGLSERVIETRSRNVNSSISAAKVQQNSETTKDKGQKRALERESRVRQSLMEGKLLWKRAEIASDYSDLNQGLYKQPGMLSEPAVQVRVHPQSDLSTAKIQQNSEITKLSSKKELPPVTPLGTNRRGISKAARTSALTV